MRCPPPKLFIAMLMAVLTAVTVLTAPSASAEPQIPPPTPGDPLTVPGSTAPSPFLPALTGPPPDLSPAAAEDPPAGQNPAPYLLNHAGVAETDASTGQIVGSCRKVSR